MTMTVSVRSSDPAPRATADGDPGMFVGRDRLTHQLAAQPRGLLGAHHMAAVACGANAAAHEVATLVGTALDEVVTR